jgi:hypothetical protein
MQAGCPEKDLHTHFRARITTFGTDQGVNTSYGQPNMIKQAIFKCRGLISTSWKKQCQISVAPEFMVSNLVACRIPGVFCRRKLLSRYRRTHGPHTSVDCCLARRQPIRTVVYPRVLNEQRRSGSYCLSRTMRTRWQGW